MRASIAGRPAGRHARVQDFDDVVMRLRPTRDEPAGVWTLASGAPVRLDAESAAGAVVLVPSEDVLTLNAELPLKSRRERLAALPFAVEEAVAEPLDQVHVALGEPTGPNRYLAGVVRHARMIQWVAALEGAGLARAAVTPDYLALPPPPEGGWSVLIDGGRALVRSADGTGFAADTSLLASAWEAAGRPTLLSWDGPLPDGLTAEPALGLPSRRIAAPPLDLRQGAYARTGQPERQLLRRLAAVAAVGVAAHTLILAVDAFLLHRMADAREAEVRQLVRQTAPQLTVSDDLAADLASRLAPTDRARGAFLPLLARASAALTPLRSTVTVRGLSFGAEGRLVLEVSAPDIAGLQRAVAALTAAGLTASSGSAAVSSTGAEGQLIIASGGAA